MTDGESESIIFSITEPFARSVDCDFIEKYSQFFFVDFDGFWNIFLDNTAILAHFLVYFVQHLLVGQSSESGIKPFEVGIYRLLLFFIKRLDASASLM